MASQTEILNTALTCLGLKRILSADDDSESAIVMRLLWPLQRDAELSSNAWGFAITRVALPASATKPAFGYGLAYPLPADYLAMVEVGENYVFYTPVDQRNAFSVESVGDVLSVLTDAGSPLRVRYVKRVENSGQYSPTFAHALAMRLAVVGCARLTDSRSIKDEMQREYMKAVKEASRNGAIERPPQKMPDETWWLARQAGA